MARLSDFLEYEQPTKYIVSSDDYNEDYETPVLTAGKSFILGYTNEKENIFDGFKENVIIFDDFTTEIKFVDFPFKVKSSAMKILHAKPNVNIKYCYYLLKSIKLDTTVHKRYWISEYSNIEVKDISLEEQNKIVEKLDKISSAIENKRMQIEDFDLYLESKYEELFCDKVEREQIGNLFEVVTGGTPSKSKSEYWENGTISWIGSNMCSDSIIYENDGKFITEDGLAHSNAKIFPIGTVCVALIGATIGKTALLKFETSTNQNIAGILVSKNNKFLPEFVFYSMQRNYYIFESMGKGFNMANLKMIRELTIPNVELKKQEEFQEIVNKVEILKLNANDNIKDLNILLEKSIQDYFI